MWVLATFFFNLAAIAVLYFYAVWKGTCDQCGRIRPDGSKYCDRCGKQFAKECPDCGQTVDIMADYCGNCGKKLSEKEDVEWMGRESGDFLPITGCQACVKRSSGPFLSYGRFLWKKEL